MLQNEGFFNNLDTLVCILQALKIELQNGDLRIKSVYAFLSDGIPTIDNESIKTIPKGIFF